MALKSRTVLETYFETNDFPTAAQFLDLIDSVPNFTDDGFLVGGENDIEAFNGGGQANATQLTKKNNRVTTSTNPNDSVKLPVGIAGMNCITHNESANIINIYPSSGGQIFNEIVDDPIILAVGDSLLISCIEANKWMYYVAA